MYHFCVRLKACAGAGIASVMATNAARTQSGRDTIFLLLVPGGSRHGGIPSRQQRPEEPREKPEAGFDPVARSAFVRPLPGRRRGVKAQHERAPGLLRNRSEEHTSELQSRQYLVCRLLLEKNKA